MSRLNAPLALSVASITVPRDVPATADLMRAFDRATITINHDRTWQSMPAALLGILDPASVERTLKHVPRRIKRCIVALCELGRSDPKETHKFESHPESGLKTIRKIQWAPDVFVRVKGACWYVDSDGRTIIPLLQPRKAALSPDRLGLYARLGRQAFCQGDWVSARTAIVDLSGEDKIVASIFHEDDIQLATDADVAEYIATYTAAKAIVDEMKKGDTKAPKSAPMDVFFGK